MHYRYKAISNWLKLAACFFTFYCDPYFLSQIQTFYIPCKIKIHSELSLEYTCNHGNGLDMYTTVLYMYSCACTFIHTIIHMYVIIQTCKYTNSYIHTYWMYMHACIHIINLHTHKHTYILVMYDIPVYITLNDIYPNNNDCHVLQRILYYWYDSSYFIDNRSFSLCASNLYYCVYTML